MRSHLPEKVQEPLTALVQNLEEELQANAHKVGKALGVDPSFDESDIESRLVRALLRHAAVCQSDGDLRVDGLTNGGFEIVNEHQGIERRFRAKKASRNKHGELVVTTATDSILAAVPDEPVFDLFHQDPPPIIESDRQQWVLAYFLDPRDLTFAEVWAAKVIGHYNEKAPFRLRLDALTKIDHSIPTPPPFQVNDEPLNIPEEGDEKGTGEATG